MLWFGVWQSAASQAPAPSPQTKSHAGVRGARSESRSNAAKRTADRGPANANHGAQPLYRLTVTLLVHAREELGLRQRRRVVEGARGDLLPIAAALIDARARRVANGRHQFECLRQSGLN